MSRRPPRRRSLLAVAALLLGNAAVLGGAPARAAVPAGLTRVIVELAGPPALAAAGSAAMTVQAERNAKSQRAILDAISDKGVTPVVQHRFRVAFNGLALEVPADDVDSLAAVPGVRAVYPDEVVTADLDVSVPLVGAPDVWRRSDGGGAAVRGAGVTVAVIDTGIDYTHPMLGKGFGDGFRVVGGYDFVNDDADPMDDNGHGTHVAGIVAGNGEVAGVAPEAELLAYKVLNRSGTGQESDIIAGIEAAIDPANPHRADVINMSLSAPGDGTDPVGRAATAAAEAGVVVVASAGNSGPVGRVQSPGSAAGVLAVGASASGVRVPRLHAVTPQAYDLQAWRQTFSANPPAAPVTLPLVDAGGSAEELEKADVAGKAVLVQPYWYPIDIAQSLEQRGAKAVVFYNTDAVQAVGPASTSEAGAAGTPSVGGTGGAQTGADAFPLGAEEGRLDSLVAVQIPGPNAVRLQSALAEGGVTVRLDSADATDDMADFSSRGPNGLFGTGPQLVAPGVEIRSASPGGGLVRQSGTSMAAPHVAGAAALLRQLHPDWSAAEVTSALAGTAHRLSGVDPLVQGQGRLDVATAARATVVATEPSISFGLADQSSGSLSATREVTLVNRGTARQQLHIRVQPAAGPAVVTASPTHANLRPGEQVTVRVAVSGGVPATDADITGWVQVDVAGPAPDLGIPYEMAVRHLTVHVTPDPAVSDSTVTAMVFSPATLAAPPVLTVRCPSAGPVSVTATAATSTSWRATLPVGTPGICQVWVGATADARYGQSVDLAGVGHIEVVAPHSGGTTADSWRSAGPNGDGGYLRFDPTDQDTVYAQPPGGDGIFVSHDAMQTWQEIHTMPVASGSVQALAVNPRDGKRLYLAMSGGSEDDSYAGRLFISSDGGMTWSTAAGLPNAAATAIGVDPTGQVLSVAMGKDVFRSTDGGATWTQLPSAWTSVRNLAWAGDDLYVGTSTGLWVIRGARTQPQAPVKVYTPSIIQFIDSLVADDGMVIASTWYDGLVASTDGGQTWHVLFVPTGFQKRFLGLRLQGQNILGVTPSGAVWVSHDRGGTWQLLPDPSGGAIDFDVASWPDPIPSKEGKLYVSASGAGIYETGDGETYTRVGLPGATVYDLTTGRDTSGRPTIVAGTTRGVYRTEISNDETIDADALEWGPSGGEGLLNVATRFVATSPADPRVLWKTVTDSFDFSVQRSEDGGASWSTVARAAEVADGLLVHPADPDSVYVGYHSLTGAGLVVTHDGGRTWAKQDARRVFLALAGDPRNKNRLLAGGADGIFESTDAGRTWRQVSAEFVTALAFDPANASHVVAGGTSLWNSRDGGRTFAPARYGLEMYARDFVFHPRDSRIVFAAASDFFYDGVRKGGRGVLVSYDGGATWRTFSNGLANKDATSLAMSPDGRHMYVGTMGGSTYRIRLPS